MGTEGVRCVWEALTGTVEAGFVPTEPFRFRRIIVTPPRHSPWQHAGSEGCNPGGDIDGSYVGTMAISKHRCRDGSRLRTRQLPSLSRKTFERAPNPPHIPSLSQENEALYLAAILRARLLDAVPDEHGRGLLSRALAREEVDQFLVAFFGSPVNVLFAKGKVHGQAKATKYCCTWYDTALHVLGVVGLWVCGLLS